MLSKRKLDAEARGLVSRIPSFNRTGLDLSGIPIPQEDKENHEQPTPSEPEPSNKKMRFTFTSTPKAEASTFKAPKATGPRRKVATSTAPSRARVDPPARRPTTTPLAASNKKAPTVAPASSTTSGPPKPAKRAAWDVKGRLADLEARYLELTNRNTEKNWECQQKETAVSDLQHDLLCYKEDTKVKDKVISDQGARLLAQEMENRFLKTRNETLETELAAKEKQCEEQMKELRDNNLHIKRMNFEIAAKDAELERNKNLNQNLEAAKARLEQSCIEAMARAAEYERLLDACEAERKRQHNAILELKGNIRVFCRVRPLLPSEVSSSDVIDFMHDGRSLAIVKPLEPNEIATKNRLRTDFKFDKVFNPSASQETIFDEISQLVQSALDGYNVCIFAYGQTGSGKTYTMEGPAQITDFVSESGSPLLGMIPRAVTQVFSTARALADRGWEYTMDVSILEIYNEILKDLLCTGAKNTPISLIKGTDSAMAATTTTRVNCEKDVYTLLKHARKNRAVAATSCNEYSSRSHCIFRLKMVGRNEKTDEMCEGTLSLVDLAGSERLKEMSLDGMRLRETKNINKSLSNLGNVILALAQKADHIPYRNSKLTQVLMNSLGGNSKTLMFINISPMEGSYIESINSLRFGTKVNSCNIGTASKVVK